MDSEFVRWSSAFHHVFVLKVKKRRVLFIDIVAEYTWLVVGKNFIVQKYIFSCLPGTIRQSDLVIKIEMYIE